MEPKDDAKLEPVVTTYEGMEAANRGLEQFQRKHAAHRKEQEVVSDKLLVTRCLDCDAEFREHYTPAKP